MEVHALQGSPFVLSEAKSKDALSHGESKLKREWISRSVRQERRVRKEGIVNQAVGMKFPDLSLEDHLGERAPLSQLAAGKFPLILAFYRGYW